ncbi:hypothetical protein [Rossellomorea sp. KS-H15a]|uniref:hypothetical protein n=1 Tax=Rossellomorea sp. KS-H15a TaxID=2963940 RepID=UPI0020C6D212|nr:hypothetical protein [Rossellomorea sp. KS-H15a]UTE77001.1 hypothetical protein M1J35_21055 [Rossellomorea sp. KS-H15a]
MIGVQDEDSYGKSGIGETPQERQRRGGSPSARGKRSLARKSTAVYQGNLNLSTAYKQAIIQ